MADRSYRFSYEVDTENIDEATERLEQSTKRTKQNIDGLSDGLDNVGGKGKASFNGMSQSLGAGLNPLRAFDMGVKGIGLSLAALGIPLLIGALTLLFKSFQRLQPVQDALAVAGAAFNVIIDKIADSAMVAIRWLEKLFTDPKQALLDLGQAIVDNITNRLLGVRDMALATFDTLKAVFTLDWDAAVEGIENYGDAVLQTATGVEDLAGKLNSLGDELAETAAKAADLAKRERELRQTGIDLLEVTARQNREIAEQRAIAIDATRSIEERAAALEAAIKIEEEQLAQRLEIAKQEAEIAAAKNALAESNLDDLEAEAQARARVIELETDSINKRREMAGQLSGFRKQALAEEAAARKDRLEAAQKIAEEIAAIDEALFLSTATETEKAIHEVEKKYGDMLAKAREYGRDTVDIEARMQEELQAIRQREIDAEVERLNAQIATRQEAADQIADYLREKRQSENEAELAAIEEQYVVLLELARENNLETLELEAQKQADITAILEAQEEERLAASRSAEQERRKLARETANANLNVARSAIGAFVALNEQAAQGDEARARRAFNLNKALRIAEVAMTSASAAVTAIGPPPSGFGPTPAGFIAAAAALGSGVAQGLAIKNTQFGSVPATTGMSGGGAGGSFSGQSLATAPTLNIPNQPNQPIPTRAYVVDEELNTQSSINRRIEQQAKLG